MLAFSTNAQDPINPTRPDPSFEEADHSVSASIEAAQKDRVDRALAALQSGRDFQTERPIFVPPAIPERKPRQERGWLSSIAEAIGKFFAAIGPSAGYLLIVVIAVAILWALYLMFGDTLGFRRARKPAKVEADISVAQRPPPDQTMARSLLEDADRLAAEGRYAEAVHLLLFRSIEDIEDRQNNRIQRSLTAREIGDLRSLPNVARTALLPIIRIVEQSYFGARPVTADLWKQARQAYQSFAFGDAWT